MSQDAPLIKINLSGKPRETSTAVFFKWAINTGKIIIAITELLALSALAYRFTVDSKIIDLHDQIKKERIFVDSQKKKEDEYRAIQNRILSIKKTEDETKKKVAIMYTILQTISDGRFNSTNLLVNQNIITLTGTALSIFPINSFIDDMKQNQNVVSISIDDLSSVDNGIRFKINIELKQNKNT